jgi:Arc/MetJ family transcription regulator
MDSNIRSSIDIDDALMAEVLKATGLKTKRQTVDLALRTLLRLRQHEEIRRFRDKLTWEGDLESMRLDKVLS